MTSQTTFPAHEIEYHKAMSALTENYAKERETTLDHSRCQYSTGIDGGLTAGQGKLDENGYWERPCEKCCDAMAAKIGESQ